jgi:hypothetical protein
VPFILIYSSIAKLSENFPAPLDNNKKLLQPSVFFAMIPNKNVKELLC